MRASAKELVARLLEDELERFLHIDLAIAILVGVHPVCGRRLLVQRRGEVAQEGVKQLQGGKGVGVPV